ncbi:hypothetical protein ACFSUS_25860 [Spirosoma soli]|uniref:Uncharacterized protein n=1 Tax=Spirosoma soli TaxID=1770529 RepID=A0ABW5MAR5_9BACT
MKKVLLMVLCVLGLGKTKSQAQSLPRLVSYSQQDTVRAIEHLFAARRTGGKIYLGVGLPLTLIGAGTALVGTTLAATVKGGEGKENIIPVTLVSAGIGLVPGSIGLVRAMRFSRSRESTILTTYQEGEALPRSIQRKLKPKFFW